MGRIWRLFVSGLSLILFGVGGLLLSIVIFPALFLIYRSDQKRINAARGIIHQSYRLFLWFVQRVGIATIEIDDPKKLAACRGCLIIANHPTLIDVGILLAVVPRLQCVVKYQLWRNIFLRGVVSAAGYIRNDFAPDEIIGRCSDTIKSGENLLIFPEGSRTAPGVTTRFQRGFANIAIAADSQIQYVVIKCDPIYLTKEIPWYRVPDRRPRFRIMVGECKDVGEFLQGDNRFSNAKRIVTEIEGYYRYVLSDGTT